MNNTNLIFKTYKIIGNHKYKIFIITFLSLLISVFEYLSLASLIPAIQLVFNPDGFEKVLHKYNVYEYFSFLGIEKENKFIFFVFLITVIFFIKTLITLIELIL